ncbi:MAG: NAD(P)H-binding protein, partial [Gemmatimonadales bacterium]|nr:NAD(P)H-binding protein [Gemmatimonadales bacterium]
MRVFLTGGTGFVGTHLIRALLGRGDECVVLSRSDRDPWRRAGVRLVPGDPTQPGDWYAEVAGCQAVVNLAGARIVDPAHRWTPARKALLRRSRIETTRCVVEAVAAAAGVPKVLISSSAIGYYGPRGDDEVDESEPAGSDFLATMAAEWEAAALVATSSVRVVIVRGGLA